MMKKILIVDDHKLIRDAIVQLFKSEEDKQNLKCYSINFAENGMKALELSKSHIYDLIIMDINMPIMDGLEASKLILKETRNRNILILSVADSPEIIKKALKIGVKGYVSKINNTDVLIEASKVIIDGNNYITKEVSDILLDELRSDNNKPFFTKREINIIKMINRQKSTSEIANLLDVSVRTIELDRKSIMKKMNVKNTIGIVMYSIKNNLIEI
tara:strand:- start:771 stop:1415 length:645 start_codon:yes stop_codon:yes gene_type:complete